MKKLILAALVAGVFSLQAFACGDDVPAAVKTKLSSLYPNAKKVKWEKEKEMYEAEFENSGVETSVLFDGQGAVTETEIEIPVSKLPAAATTYLAKNHAGKKVSEAAMITDAAGKVSYEAEVKGVGDVIFDESGSFLKNEVEDKD